MAFERVKKSFEERWPAVGESVKDAFETVRGGWGIGDKGSGSGRASAAGSGLVDRTVAGVSNLAAGTVERTARAVESPVFGPLIAIGFLWAAVKGVQNWFGRKEKADQIAAIEEDTRQVQARIDQLEGRGSPQGEYGRYQMPNHLYKPVNVSNYHKNQQRDTGYDRPGP